MSVYQNSKVFPARICLSTYFRFFPILSRKTAIAEGKIGYCLNEIHCHIKISCNHGLLKQGMR